MANRVEVLKTQTAKAAPSGGFDATKVRVIYLDNPPMNALGINVRRALIKGMEEAEKDPKCEVIVITGKGAAFSAGADISEFSAAMQPPFLPEVIDRIELSSKLVVAAVNGLAMGGGTELALGCHLRVASPKAFFALPEIKLGLIPGAGGTQRLPRLCGPQFAIQMCCSGGNIKAPVALKNGLADVVVDAGANVVAEAARLGLEHVAKKLPIRRLRNETGKLGNSVKNYFVFRAARQQITANTPSGMTSPLRALDAVQAACSASNFADGLKAERDIFMQCAQSPQAAAMQHFFKSERRATKIPGIPEGVKPKAIRSVGVLGGGTMGGGIAMNFLNIGIPVVLLETSVERQKFCVDTIAGNYKITMGKGKLTQEQFDKRMGLLRVVVGDYSAFQDVDFIIEAVFENMKLKKEIFAKLDRVCKADCVLASNTSTLSIDEIASATTRPQKVIGAHFFSPANVMKLLEFVRGQATDAQTIVTSMAVGRMIKKAPVLVGNCFGFVSNRMILRGGFSAMCMLEEGCLPAQIDAVIKEFGFPMGVFAMQDLAGLDVGSKIRSETPAHFIPKRDVTQIPDVLVKAGRFGQKTQKGWYKYAPDAPRKPIVDSEVEAIVVNASKAKKMARRSFDKNEILERYLYIMINEAALLLQEGFAIRPSDIDIVFIYGFGFPPYRGGPCMYADQVGIPKVVERMKKYHTALGADTFPTPCQLLVDMATKNGSFGVLNGK